MAGARGAASLMGWLRVLPAAAILAAASRLASAESPVPPHQTLTIDSKVLGETRRIYVYRPPGYERAPRIRYPVLYMPDGGLGEDFPHVARDVDTAIRANEMRPVIVVGIENTERRRDMTGPTEVESDRKIAPRVGDSARFRGFIRDELMPVVRERYRGNGETAIVGESLAGLFVLETFLEEPALFDTYIALSPSLWWNGGALVRGAAERLRAPARRGSAVALYLGTAGDDGLEASARDLTEALRAAAPRGMTWKIEAWPHEKHSTIYGAVSPAVFRRMFPPAQPRR